jgi:hypothetical protein
MMISWWSKHVGVILSVLMCDVWINVLLQTSALVGPLHVMNWNARWNSENHNHVQFYKFRHFFFVSYKKQRQAKLKAQHRSTLSADIPC